MTRMGKISFRDWLAEQTSKRPGEQEVAQKKQDWLDALESLYTQTSTWIREDDPAGAIKIWRSSETIEEEELGTYSAPSLFFVLNQRRVAAIPIARNVIGPGRSAGPLAPIRGEGRVDLTGGIDR